MLWFEVKQENFNIRMYDVVIVKLFDKDIPRGFHYFVCRNINFRFVDVGTSNLLRQVLRWLIFLFDGCN